MDAHDRLGPEWYQRIRAHTAHRAKQLLRHALGREVLHIRKDRTGASHAVYFATLAPPAGAAGVASEAATGGADAGAALECVLRVVMHAEEDVGVESWMAERCRERGVPAPEVLACDPIARHGRPPYIVTRRLPGVPAHPARLPAPERRRALRQMGGYLAAIHTIPVAGFGPLVRHDGDFRGRQTSLWSVAEGEITAALERLPDVVLSSARRETIHAHFAAARKVLDLPTAVACHGDFRLKNALLLRELPNRDSPENTFGNVPTRSRRASQERITWRVSGILDFELAHAGDPARDLAYFFYSLRLKPWSEADLAAVCDGYGVAYPLDPELRQRVLLYQILSAVGHLWWAASFDDAGEVHRVVCWLDEFTASLG